MGSASENEIEKDNDIIRTKDFLKIRFDGIQILRALAAIMISFYHMNFIYNMNLKLNVGVDIFFVISGFVIMFTTEKSTNNFMKKRLVKILPLYWLLTILAFLSTFIIEGIVPYKPTFLELLKSLLFIPYSRVALRTATTVRPIVGPAHTLMYEMFFYVLFYISLKINKKNRGLIASLFIGLVILVRIIFNYFNIDFIPLQIWGDIQLIEFVVGMILYYIMELIYKKCEFKIDNKFSIIILFFSTILIFSIVGLNIPFFVIAFFSFLIVLGYSIAFYNLKSPKILLKIGEISYSYYLVHYFVILIIKKVTNSMEELNIKSIIVGILSVLISLIIAYISWYLIENKFTLKLKKVLKI